MYACHVHQFKGTIMPFRAFPSRQAWSSALIVRLDCALSPLGLGTSATYILYPPPTVSLVLSSFAWGALGCLHGFRALCASFVYRVVGFGYSLPSFSFETGFDFGAARSIFARLAVSFVASSTYISLPPPAISLTLSSYPFTRVWVSVAYLPS